MWILDIRPKKIDQLLINDGQKNELHKWINELDNVCLFITGKSGTGKSTVANALLAEYGYEVKELNATNLRSVTVLKKTFKDAVMNKFWASIGKKMALVIENVDLFSTGDAKGLLNEFIRNIDEINKKNGFKNPIICTANDITKPLKKLCNHTHHFPLNNPNVMQIMELSRFIIKEKKMGLNNSCVALLGEYITDYRQLINTLEYLYNVYGGDKLGAKELYDFLKSMDVNDTDHQLNRFMKQLVSRDLSVKEYIDGYETDPLLIPDTIYENYIKFSYGRSCGKDKKYEILADMSDLMSQSVGLYQKMGPNLIWNVTNVYGFYSTVKSSKYLHKQCNKGTPVTLAKSRLFSIDQQISNNNKRILKLYQPLGIGEQEMITLVELITYNLFGKKGDINEAAKLILEHGIDLDTMFREILTVAKHKGKIYDKKFTKTLKNNIVAAMKKIQEAEKAEKVSKGKKIDNKEKELVLV